MDRHYIALVHQDKGSDIGVSFPDFPGCVTAVSNIDDVVQSSTEALALHIEGMLEDGETVPEPSAISSVDKGDAMLAVVIPAPLVRKKVRRINVTIDESLISRIDSEAQRRGLNRSAFLAEGARRMMGEK